MARGRFDVIHPRRSWRRPKPLVGGPTHD